MFSVALSRSLSSFAKFSLFSFVFVSSAFSRTIYVNPSSTSSAPDGSATDAFPSIDAAYTAASDGDILSLSADTFTLTSELLIDKAVTISGAGIDQTIIRQTGGNQRVIALSNALARVEYCTLTGGKFTTERGRLENDLGGPGVLICAAGGTLSHCRITGNSSNSNHNRGIGIDEHSENALVEYCIIDNNTVTGGTNGSYAGIAARYGSYSHCLIYQNKGHQTGGIYVSGPASFSNCTITDNTTTDNPGKGAGGIMITTSGANSTFTDCIITSNRSDNENASSVGAPNWNIERTATFNNCAFDNPISPTLQLGTPFQATTLFLSSENYLQRISSPTIHIGYDATTSFTSPQCDFVLSSYKVRTGTEITFTPTIIGFPPSSSLSYEWEITLPDKTTTTLSASSPTYTPALHGTYSVSLTITDAVSQLAISSPLTIPFSACDEIVNVTTIEELNEALSIATPGTTINAAPGTYNLTGELTINTAVSLIGAGIDQSTILQTTSNSRIVILNNALATIEGFTIRGARMSKEQIHGLGVRILSLGGTVRNCLITDNQKTGGNWTHGYGIAMTGPGVIDHCIISNNNTKSTLFSSVQNCYGAGLYATMGVVSNTLVHGNHGWRGAGVYTEGNVSLVNCTIVGNTAHRSNGSGGGVYVKGKASFINTLIYGNFVPDNAAATDSTRDIKTEDTNPASNQSTFRNCLLPPACESVFSHTENCSFGVATFVDPAASDYHPLSSSTSIDNGDATGFSPTATDLDGSSRISGSTIDIGCFEFDSSAFSCVFTSSKSQLFHGESLILSPALSGATESDIISFAWTISKPDGTTESSTLSSITYTPTICGNYTVSLSASIQGGPTSPVFEIPDCFYVAPRTIFLKEPTEETSPLFPYDTQATAATSLHDALAAAIDGSSIELLPGNHTISSKIEISSAIILRGAGYETTSLSPTFSGDSIMVINNPLAIVTGLTIRGFRTSKEVHSRGAVIIESQGGLVENCRITDNVYDPAINHAKGVGITLNGKNARVNRCIIDRNMGSNGVNGDRGGGVQAIAGTIENSLICFNTNSCAGGIFINGTDVLVRGCTIVGNVAYGTDTPGYGYYGSGGIFSTFNGENSARVENCIIAFNESPNQTGFTGYPDWREDSSMLSQHSSFFNCLFTPDVTLPTKGANSINGNPLFKSLENGDFHFPLSSPCRNAGLNAPTDASSLDLDGKPRRKGRFTDIGCYELPFGPATILITK